MTPPSPPARRDPDAGPGVLHMTIGNEWAGVAAHLHDLLPGLGKRGLPVTCVLFSEGLVAERLREAGVDVVVLERDGRYDWRVLRRIRTLLRERDVRVLHLHGYMAITSGCFASLLLPVKRVVTLHQPSQRFDEIASRRFRLSLKFAYRLVKRLGASFIAVSDNVGESYVRNHGIRRDRIHLVRNGVAIVEPASPAVLERWRAERGLAPDDDVVTIVGRLDPIKGHSYFLEAARRVLAERPRAVFLVVGDGPLGPELREHAARLGLGDRVRFVGFRRDVEEFLAITDVLVISSVFEGLPYTLLQALSAGVPVVATRCEGLCEVLEDRREALLVPKRSDAAIAGAVREILEDPALAERLGENGRATVRRSYGCDAMVERTIDVYRRARET